MSRSSIEWTHTTWNPVTGCTKVSPGCKHCYAERFANRLQAMGNGRYAQGFRLTIHPDSFQKPLEWKKPRMIFINSMSDLLHENVDLEVIHQIFQVMERACWHKFQVLTKRASRLEEVERKLTWPSNLWMGVSVENADYKMRIDELRETSAPVKFLSIEPLIGAVGELNLTNINWVIVGGESGPKARPLDKQWVRNIRDQCIDQRVPFFFKQWGGRNKKAAGRVLDGRTWNEFPAA